MRCIASIKSIMAGHCIFQIEKQWLYACWETEATPVAVLLTERPQCYGKGSIQNRTWLWLLKLPLKITYCWPKSEYIYAEFYKLFKQLIAVSRPRPKKIFFGSGTWWAVCFSLNCVFRRSEQPIGAKERNRQFKYFYSYKTRSRPYGVAISGR